MERALGTTGVAQGVLFEVDSLLVARQVQVFGVGKFACRSANLIPRLLHCIRVGQQLDARGIPWRIRHIYREYNQTADALANEAIDFGDAIWRPPAS